MDLKDQFTFGKYKGKLLSDVADHDPSYVLWCCENIDWFDIDKDLMEAIEMDAREQDAEWYAEMHDEGAIGDIY